MSSQEPTVFRYRDLVLALICAFLGSVKGLLVSQVKSLGAVEIFGLRSIGATCFIFPIIVFFNFTLWYDTRCNLVLLMRSLVGNIAVCGYYFGFVYLPIAEASILFYSTPVFTVIIGCIFLQERCGPAEVFSVVLSLVGVALVTLPDFTFNSDRFSDGAVKGVAGSLIGAIAQAGALVIVRKITHVPPPVVSFWWAFVGIIFSTVLTTAKKSPMLWECGLEVVFVILIAVVGFVSELCLVAALKSTNAVIVSIALTSEIVWAFVLQVSVSQQVPNLMCIFGGVAIVLALMVSPLMSLVCLKDKDVDHNKVPYTNGEVKD